VVDTRFRNPDNSRASLHESSAIADELLDRCPPSRNQKVFWPIAQAPIVRERLVRANPALLDSPDLTSLPAVSCQTSWRSYRKTRSLQDTYSIDCSFRTTGKRPHSLPTASST